MKKAPTDLVILETIYSKYYDEYKEFNRHDPTRTTNVYIPIDVVEVAKKLKTDPDIVFGRLYYDLEMKYGFKQDDGSKVHFFKLRIRDENHLVQFPLLASVLSRLQEEKRKFVVPTVISFIALFVSIVSIVLSTILSS